MKNGATVISEKWKFILLIDYPIRRNDCDQQITYFAHQFNFTFCTNKMRKNKANK